MLETGSAYCAEIDHPDSGTDQGMYKGATAGIGFGYSCRVLSARE